jgi:hypothetical protein
MRLKIYPSLTKKCQMFEFGNQKMNKINTIQSNNSFLNGEEIPSISSCNKCFISPVKCYICLQLAAFSFVYKFGLNLNSIDLI